MISCNCWRAPLRETRAEKKPPRGFAFRQKYFWIPLGQLVGQLRSPHQIVSIWPQGEVALGPKIVLFMHYDGRGLVRRQLLDYVRDLKENGRSVVFVSNAGQLQASAMSSLREICVAVILQRNIGYDFCAWRDALEFLGLPRRDTEEVIFANDSVFGPLAPLGDILRRINYNKADIWGLTEGWQFRYHLQSFFLAFGRAALRAEAFGKFWNNVRPVPVKSFIVQAYEVGITQAMVKGELRCAALWSYETLMRQANREGLEKLILAEESELGRNDPIHVTRKLQASRAGWR
jgi:Rhamnan synthesis protein F